jgi:hypothetical protein
MKTPQPKFIVTLYLADGTKVQNLTFVPKSRAAAEREAARWQQHADAKRGFLRAAGSRFADSRYVVEPVA